MNRRDQVLKLIVEHFIKYAQPVGSKTLIDEYNLDVSSATIRSEMNALEQDGYLEQPHASSGRVPSAKGYHYYIDNLREKSVDEKFKYQMQTLLEQKVQSVEDIIKESCEILSQMTSLASIVLGPNAKEEQLVSVQLIPITNSSATCVFITNQGNVENKTFVLDENVKLDDVQKCVNLLNERLKGTSITELVPKMEAIKPILKDYIIDHDVIYQAMLESFLSFTKDRLEAYGKEELLEQPEFKNDAGKIKQLLDLLEHPEVFREAGSEGDISIHIGGDNGNDNDISIVSAKVNVPGYKEGSIAIVGPKRMDYSKVVSSIEYLIEELSKKYNLDDRKDDNGEGEESNQGRKINA